ncbi:adenosylmethionine decarboxylase [Sagittula sp. P11]|nr:adenosylmethionine decarboxylase [Sagittula sp. P11]
MYGASALVDVGPAKDVLRRAGLAAGATVLQVAAHDFGARAGFTGFALLAESHISVHTWPEFGIATVDIFMCGSAEPEKSLDVLLSYFGPSDTSPGCCRAVAVWLGRRDVAGAGAGGRRQAKRAAGIVSHYATFSYVNPECVKCPRLNSINLRHARAYRMADDLRIRTALTFPASRRRLPTWRPRRQGGLPCRAGARQQRRLPATPHPP